MRILALFLVAGFAFAQTSRYPAALDSDSSLFVVADNVQTSLTASMAVSDTTATVASAAGFVANMIATICDTATNTGKCTAWEHMLVTSVAGNILTVTRAFAGTTARSHSSGRLVSALIDAVHQKVLKDSIVAMETALGPNLSNVQGYRASNYNWVQSPGGTLSPGTQSITLTPCPQGVAGTYSTSRVYLTGGTGTSEAAPITGGTCTPGAATGTIFVTAANSHSGAWTAGSASSGLQEAVQAVKAAPGQSGVINVGSGGPTILYGPVTITGVQVRIVGNSIQSIAIQRHGSFNWDHAFKIYDGGSAMFEDLNFTAGDIDGDFAAIKVYAVATSGVLHARNMIISGGKYGIISDSSGSTILDHVYLLNGDSAHVGNAGIQVDCNNGVANNIFLFDVVTNYFGTPQVSRGLDVLCVDGLTINHSGFQGQNAMVFGPTNGKHVYNVNISNTFLDNFGTTGIIFASSGTGRIRSFNWNGGSVHCESAANFGVDMGNTFGAPNMDYVSFSGAFIQGCKQSGVFIPRIITGGTSIAILNSTIVDNGQVTGPGISIATGAGGLRIEGNRISGATQSTGIAFGGTASGTFIGNDLCGNASDPVQVGGAVTGIFQNNKCVNDSVTWAYMQLLNNLPLGTVIYATDANATCSAAAGTGRNCQHVAAGWVN